MHLAVILALAASPAQEAPPTLEHALAAAIAKAMPDLRYPWQLEWSAFGSYGSRDIRWHLAPPQPGYEPDPPPSGMTRRTGWLSIDGRSASISACGDDDRVGAMMMETSDIWLGDGDLTPELAEAGVVATLLEQRDLPPILAEWPGSEQSPYYIEVSARPAYRRIRLEQQGREPALVTATYVCTGPGMRSATRCAMHWTVELRAGTTPRSEPCLAPADTAPAVRLD